MSPVYDTIYDYASVLKQLADASEGTAAQLEPHDLILFIAQNTGLLACGEVIMTGNMFTVNGIEIGHRDKGVNVVTVQKFWFLPEPEITRFEQFNISCKRLHSFLDWSVQFLGVDKQWREGILSSVSTIKSLEVDSISETYIQLKNDEKKYQVAPLIAVMIVAPKSE